jgi:amino acid adenylation domain-containing protein
MINLAEVVAAGSQRTPDRCAVESSATAITYAELHDRSRAAAGALRAMGVEVGDRVVLNGEIDLDWLVAMLGTLHAGAICVPLDPSHPPQRREAMCRRLRPARILVSDGIENPPEIGSPITRMSALRGPAQDTSRVGEAAFILHTSGSTGVPKAVILAHRGLLNHCEAAGAVFGLTADTRMALLNRPGSDIVLEETFPVWRRGGAVVLPKAGTPLFGAGFNEEMAVREVTALDLPTGRWREWTVDLERADATVPNSVTTVIVGGELAGAADYNRWLRVAGPRRRWINSYGPTEASVIATCWVGNGLPRNDDPPIGLPLPGVRTRIRDSDGRTVPDGDPGELYLGGIGVGLGYFEAPEATRAAFVRDGAQGAGTWYRTGDRVRRTESGVLEFLGRVDDEVKIAGVRVHPREVEAVLQQCPTVRDAAVVPVRRPGRSPMLAAFVVPADDEPDPSDSMSGAESGHVSQWREVYQQDLELTRPTDETFDTDGWNSSYTGNRLSDSDMLEWVGDTVSALHAAPHGSVLEIGCGTGLLLFRLAPHSTRYVASDFAEHTLRRVAANAERLGLAAVRTRLAEAVDGAGLADGEFDLVVINSVTQHFPSERYLRRTLDMALRVTREGGHVFVGDVRNLALLRDQHTSVELYRAHPDDTIESVRSRVAAACANENELLIDAGWFYELARQDSRVGNVGVAPKLGRHRNEMNQFRFDVMIRRGTSRPMATTRVPWAHALGLAQLDTILGRRPGHVIVADIRNGQLADTVPAAVVDHAPGGDPITTVEPSGAGVHPADIAARAAAHGYATDWAMGSGGAGHTFTVLLSRADTEPVDLVALAGGEQLVNWPAATAQRHRRRAAAITGARRWLGDRLPGSMMPAVLEAVDALPLTDRGKIDTSLLAAGAARSADAAGTLTSAPRLRAVAAVWSDVLGLGTVGPRTNFLAAGGDSLLAARMLARISDELGLAADLRTLFDHPELAQFCQSVVDRVDKPSAAVAVTRGPGAIPLSSTQFRLWLAARMSGASARLTLWAVYRMPTDVDVDALEAAVADLRLLHPALGLRVTESDSGPAQIFDVPVRLTVKSATADPLVEARRAAAEPFDLVATGAFRSVLWVDDHGRPTTLGLYLHHLAGDETAMTILAQDLGSRYAARLRGAAEADPTPVGTPDAIEPPVDLDRGRRWWTGALAELPPHSPLPFDRPPSSRRDAACAEVRLAISGDELATLRSCCRSAGTTLFMALLAVLAALLARHGDARRIGVITPFSVRAQGRWDRIVGPAVNPVVIAVEVDPDMTFMDLLARARDRTLAAFDHGAVPFQEVVRAVAPRRLPGVEPLSQVMLQVVAPFAPRIPLGGHHAERLDLPAVAVRFDMEIFGVDRGTDLELVWTFATDVFDPQTVQRLAQHFGRLLRAATLRPDRPIRRHGLLDESERQRLEAFWGLRA